MYHLFVKEPGQGMAARSMSQNLAHLAAYGDFQLKRGNISNYEIFESDSTDWKVAWTEGVSVLKRSFSEVHNAN